MTTKTRIRDAILMATILMTATLGASAAPVDAADPLDDVPLELGTSVLFDEARNDGRQGSHGRWSLAEGQLADGHLRLRVAMDPPRQGLPVTSGPAVLFAGMQVLGGAGDVGVGEPLSPLSTVVLPPCDDSACHYVADIDLPVDELPGAMRRLEEHGDVRALSVELTLVRTFGAGQWLQVIPLQGDSAEQVGAPAGHLGAIEPAQGSMFPFGLFPAKSATPVPKGSWMFTTPFDYGRAVERIRARAEDPSVALAMVEARLRVDISPTCDHSAHLTMHDDAGDRVFDAEAFGAPRIEGIALIPVHTTWRLTLHDGGGIDFDQGRLGWGVRIGRIESAGPALDINATFDCATAYGSIDVIGGVAAPTESYPSPEIATPSGSAVPSASRKSPDVSASATATATTTASGRSAYPLVPVSVLVAAALVGVLLARRWRRRRDAR